jgi:hypothetical protein
LNFYHNFDPEEPAMNDRTLALNMTLCYSPRYCHTFENNEKLAST